jgi:hypothetical protein
MWLIISVTLASVFVFLIYKVWFDKKIQTEWLKTTIETLIVFLFMPLCFYFITSYVQDIKNKEFQNKIQKFQKTLINTVYSQSIDTEQLNELIRLKHKEIFQSSTVDAEKFANKLLTDLDQKKKELDNLSNNTNQLIRKLYLKWKPFYDFVLSSFDDRVNELIKHDDKVNYDQNDGYTIVYDADIEKHPTYSLRRFEKHGKTLFKINFYPGAVREGLCIKNLTMIIYEQGYQVFKFHFTEDGIILDPDYKKYRMFNANTKKDNPLEDEEFRNKTIEAINLLISSSYLR